MFRWIVAALVLISVESAAQDLDAVVGAPREVRTDLIARGIPPIPPAVSQRVAPYQEARTAGFASWVPGGGTLVITRFGDTAQVHRVDQPLGMRRQLTFGREPVSAAWWAPWRGVDGFLFLRDVGGAEAYRLHHQDARRGTATPLTAEGARTVGVVLSESGTQVAFANTARNKKDHDIYVMDLARDEAPRLVAEREGHWEPRAFSPDGASLALLRYVSATEAEAWLLDLATKAVTRVAPSAAPCYDEPVAFSPSGDLYLVSDRFAEVRELALAPKGGGELRRLTADIPWDVESADVAPDGTLAFVVNEGGLSRVVVQRGEVRSPLGDGALPTGVIGGLRFDPAGERLAVTVSATRTPGDVYVLTLADSSVTQWTASEAGGLDPSGFVLPALVHVPTFDSVDGAPRKVPAFVFRPEGPGPHPVVIFIHGGPESQWRPGFSALVQHWVADLGIAVIAPNVRGSSGYGKTYLALDNGMLREDSVKDIGALLDWIGTDGGLDPKRVGVFGGSYGGYMVLASLARHGDRIKAGAEIVGISNFVTFLERTQEYRRDLRRAEYGDERDPDMRAHLLAISPTQLVSRIRSPLFVAQGANDPRVPVGESDQIAAAVAGQGTPVWYLLAKDEGHGFAKRKNRDYYFEALTHFWEEHLLPKP
ncbi:MAG: peptidase [Myxococcales bacterium]